jgi:methionyl-tRNA synthetase
VRCILLPLVSDQQRYLVTSALPYANGPLHIGHLSGAYLTADIFVKFLRMKGEEVLYICGSDEHGAAITLRAKNEGISPREIVDKYHASIKDSFEKLEFDFDIYHRTSAPLHHDTAQAFFTELNDKGIFTKEVSEQFYDEEYHQFLADRYVTGECPNCHYEKAYGDQCENCGTSLSPKELIDPVSTLSGKSPVLRETEHFYLPMDQYQDWVGEWLEKGTDEGKAHHDPSEWKKHVLGQCISWLNDGLKPRAMTRDLDWGVKVPGSADGKVLYVWMDAPIGYISASKEWAKDTGGDWERFWKDENSKLVHFIGKDNIVFHCIIFPILLKVHGGFVLPDNVPANEFMNLEGQKISTSRNWAVWVHEYLENYPDRVDELRYVLTSIAPESKDAEFTWADFQARVNNELVAILGNFVNRSVVLTHTYFNGEVPQVELNDTDKSVLEEVKKEVASIEENIMAYRFRMAQAAMINIARIGNKYLADEEPWKKIKEDPERVKQILRCALEICKTLSQVGHPFLPQTARKLRVMLGIEDLGWSVDADLSSLQPAEILFQKVEAEMVETEMARLKPQTEEPEKTDYVEFEDFGKMDLRIGEITAAEKHPDADKLLVLKVQVGEKEHNIVSGIAEHYEPTSLIGKRVCLLANLKPKKLRGIMSEGMILMAEDAEGKLAFLEPDGDMPSGAKVS